MSKSQGMRTALSPHVPLVRQGPSPEPVADHASPPSRRFRLGLGLASSVVAAGYAFHASQYDLVAQGIGYLDMADAWLRGDYRTAINSHWSPGLSGVIAAAKVLFRIEVRQEFLLFPALNLLAFILSIFSLDFLARGILRLPIAGQRPIDSRALFVLAFSVNLALATQASLLRSHTPDMFVCALVYLVSGLVLRIRGGDARLRCFLGLGALIGGGFLLKAIMLPLGLVDLAVAAVAARPLLSGWGPVSRRVLVALLPIVVLVGGWSGALTQKYGRFTWGDAGRDSFHFEVNGVDRFYLSFGSAPGKPVHPIQHLSEKPPVRYYGDDQRQGTFPLIYDPGYWVEGLHPHLSPAGLAPLWAAHLGATIVLFLEILAPFFAVLAALALFGARVPLRRIVLANWTLTIPALAGLGAYFIVHLEYRYVAPFAGMLYLAAFGSLGSRPSGSGDRATFGIALVAALLSIVPTANTLASGGRERDLATGLGLPRYLKFVDTLRAIGLKSGDRVAVMGSGRFMSHEWARLAGVQIVADIPLPCGPAGLAAWNEDPVARNLALAKLKAVGAKAIIGCSALVRGVLTSAAPGWIQPDPPYHFLVQRIPE